MQSSTINKKQFKPVYMPELKLKQLQYEAETWKRLLGFMMDENIHLKNRLSEILKDRFDKNLLEEVEGFQSRFVKEDQMIGLLRNEVVELDKLLVREIFEDGSIIKNVDKKLKNLRNNISNAEKQFGKLKSEFNSYLSENM
jgi:regulator of replication initiation timing